MEIVCFVTLSATAQKPAEADVFCHALHSFYTFSQAIYLSPHLPPTPLCSGIGKCGHCAIRFISPAPQPSSQDIWFFSELLLSQGWRLGCQHKVTNDALVALHLHKPLPKLHKAHKVFAEQPQQSKDGTIQTTSAPRSLYLGIDLGTTSLAWGLCQQDGTIVKTGQRLNPQLGAGLDTISRLAFAEQPAGQHLLHSITLEALCDIFSECKARYGDSNIAGVCVAANPAMTAIALNVSTHSLAVAPYSLPFTGSTKVTLPGLPPCWIPPHYAPFVGGDIAAGFAWLQANYQQLTYPFLLADLGTNAELLLALTPEKILVTSIALGPALEGIGLTHGTLVGQDTAAITHFSLTPKGLHAHITHPENAPPLGISGTGYLSLLKILLLSKAMQKTGHFTLEQAPLIARQQKSPPCTCFACQPTHHAPLRAPQTSLRLPHNMVLYAEDVENVLKVKASFSLGVQILLQEGGISHHTLSAIYLAGAFGEKIDTQSLELLGFFPQGTAKRLFPVGNSSLLGACLLARSIEDRKKLSLSAACVRSINLAEHPDFTNRFADHMVFAFQQKNV